MTIQERIEEAISKVAKEHIHLADKLTEKQFCNAMKQALACGDFQRLIRSDGSQSVVYIPYARERELLSEISMLKSRMEGTLIEGGCEG